MLEEAEDRAARAAVEGRTSAPVTKQSGREMTGFLSTLSPAQQEAAKAYRGDDWLGYQPKVGERCVNNGEDCVWDGEDFAPIPAKPLVIIESPYAGPLDNIWYAQACLLDSLRRGEAPIASHLLHTQVLDDLRPDERELGIEAGLAWYRVAEKCVVYEDRGTSGGMITGIRRARQFGVPVEFRRLEVWRDAA
ncbi:hypothetical protein NJB93_21305 [Brucella intermedia]|uniref:DUF7768 domain-containing protein n=1 Tax=Brucella intermedia TaxID=94625 RepID=UPI00209B500D|nr:hypothetical protein [Brucella intermedia]MCO7729085.1 hypothetical protein [Brucella intermedia]